MNVGSCDISELVKVGEGRTDAVSNYLYNSFMNVAEVGQAGTSSLINGLYQTFGVNPVGRPGVYACPRDFEAIIVDRRTGWELEKRLSIAIAVLLIAFILIRMYKK